MLEPLERHIDYYRTADGHIPYREWHAAIKDARAQAIIDSRLGRVRLGLFGQCEPVGEGVLELKIDYGPGYRVYFAPAGESVVLLLLGGDKSSQRRDIRKARDYWEDYRRRHS